MTAPTMDASPLNAAEAPQTVGTKRRGYWSTVWDRLRRDPVTIGCATIILVILLAAIFAPLIAPHDPYKTSMLKRLAPVGSENFLLGTDELGRDMLSRLIYGGRVSLFTAIAPVLGALLIGGTLGVLAGFLGGRVNMNHADDGCAVCFSSILLAIAISGALGSGIGNAVISLTLIFTADCRVAETVTTQVRNLDFVQAARGHAGQYRAHSACPYSRQRARPYSDLCFEPGQCLNHRCFGS